MNRDHFTMAEFEAEIRADEREKVWREAGALVGKATEAAVQEDRERIAQAIEARIPLTNPSQRYAESTWGAYRVAARIARNGGRDE